MRNRVGVLLGVALVGTALLGSACSSASASNSSSDGKITAVGAENEYADVISQIGGQYVSVSAIMSDPATDPHTYEASANVAKEVRAAQLVVQNGIGYDDFMTKIENAAQSSGRTVINVQQLRNLPDNTPNPHLWYDPATMPVVAKAIADTMAKIQPDHASYFQANVTTFDNSLTQWKDALAAFKSQYPNTPVAASEPVADYMLQAAGANIMSPMSLQLAVMNGTDPAPQDVSTQAGLISGKKIKVLLYNQQVTDDLTKSWLAAAQQANIPVVGVYETMPTPGYNYQSWMVAEVNALQKAVANGTSTGKL